MNNEVYSIDFLGEISGNAKKTFLKESARIAIYPTIGVVIFIAIVLLFLYSQTQKTLFLWLMAIDLPALLVAGQIPPPKAQIKKTITQRVIVDGDMIVAINRTGEVCKYIEDASALIDYGDHYFVKFPFGNLSEYFVCQKDLLKNGTLEEFEALFEGKIERVDSN